MSTSGWVPAENGSLLKYGTETQVPAGNQSHSHSRTTGVYYDYVSYRQETVGYGVFSVLFLLKIVSINEHVLGEGLLAELRYEFTW